MRPAAKRPILFLDIDGVLMSGRAWLMPSNRALRARTKEMPGWEAGKEIGRAALFDPCAVALVIEVCDATDARLVVSSGWRYTVGVAETRAKLLEQGIHERLFHEDWTCSLQRHGSPDKYVDIQNWIEGHGAQAPGSWLVLDDEPLATPDPTLLVDDMEGLGAHDAAAAIRYFGAVSSTLGMTRLADEDIPTEVRSAFSGRWIEACQWLEGADNGDRRGQRPSALLARGDREEALRRLPGSANAPRRAQASDGALPGRGAGPQRPRQGQGHTNLEDVVGSEGAAHLQAFATAAARALPGAVEQVVLLLPVRHAADFPHQVAVVLRIELRSQDEERANLREVHAKLEKAALPATMEGHAVTVYIVPSHSKHWLPQQFLEQSIAIDAGTGS